MSSNAGSFISNVGETLLADKNMVGEELSFESTQISESWKLLNHAEWLQVPVLRSCSARRIRMLENVLVKDTV